MCLKKNCDQCMKGPIEGPYYTCTMCITPCYDLCLACYMKRSVIHDHDIFLRVPESEDHIPTLGELFKRLRGAMESEILAALRNDISSPLQDKDNDLLPAISEHQEDLAQPGHRDSDIEVLIGPAQRVMFVRDPPNDGVDSDPGLPFISPLNRRVAFIVKLSYKCKQLGIGPINWSPLVSRRELLEMEAVGSSKKWACVYLTHF